MKAPCMNCNDRKMLCHAYCEKYNKYKKAVNKIKLKKKEEQKVNDYVIGNIISIRERTISSMYK